MIALMNLDIEKIQSIYDEAKKHIRNQEFLSAIEILQEGVEELKDINACFFDEIFQLMLWTREHKKVNGYAIEKMNMYYLLGYCLVELGDNKKAMDAFKIALRFHPYDIHSRFEIIQILKNENNFEKAHEALKNIHRYIFRPDDLAHLYRDYGWTFIEMKEWAAAATCYILSQSYADESGYQRSEHELEFIEEVTGEDAFSLVPEDNEEFEKMATKYHFPIGFNESIIKIAFDEYSNPKNRENDNMEKYLREICLVFDTPLNDLRNVLMEKMQELEHSKFAYQLMGEKSNELFRTITISLEIYYKTDDSKYMAENMSWDVFEKQVRIDVREKIYSANEKVNITEEMKEWLDL